MTTLNTQKDFFSTVTSDEYITNDAIEIYQDLIYLRFEDVINSSFPIYCSNIDKDILEKEIKEFISYGSHSAFVWKIPFEFKQFLFNNKNIGNKYKEILEFEAIQIKMYVSNKKFRSTKYDWNKRYRLSSNAKILKSKYNLLAKDDFINETQYILIYKDINDYDVYYIEITKILYSFFKNLRNLNRANQALELATKKMNLNYFDVKNIISNTLINFTKNGILST